MKATLDKLMHAVQGIAKQNVAQVTVSVKTIHDRLLALRNVPSLLESQVDGGTRSQSRTGEELASLAEACIDGECGKIDSELEKLKEVEEQLIETVAIVSRILPSTINELLAQTEESGKNMQELAKLLRVDSTKVVERVKAMLQEREKTKSPQQTTARTSPSPSIQSRSQGGFDDLDTQPNVGHMFAAMALPEVEIFKDPQGRGFSKFVTRFGMKYGNLGLRDDMLAHLLFSKLEGYPKAVAEALPKYIREGSFQEILEALRSKFKTNESANQMKAYMEFKHLKMTKDVTRYCLELESLSRKAYPDASEGDLSRTRAGELVSQLTGWLEYLHFFTTMELAPKESAYKMVKAMAQR
ncbi:hypothetical protein Y032_0577g222, partial [Ancylostoma ceylanicum]